MLIIPSQLKEHRVLIKGWEQNKEMHVYDNDIVLELCFSLFILLEGDTWRDNKKRKSQCHTLHFKYLISIK